MRIAILADPIDNQQAGIHYYTREFLTQLGKSATRHEYIAIRLSPNPEIKGIKNLVIRNYSQIPGYKAFRMFIGLPSRLSRLNIDAVVEPAHFGPFNLPSRIRRVTVIHDLTPVKFPQYHRFHSQLLQKIFLKGILKRADMIIANSINTEEDIKAYMPSVGDRVRHIYLGKDPVFKNTRDEGLVINKYNLQQPYCLYTGTIEPRKNLLTLLKAFGWFKQEHKSPLQLVIAGIKGWKSSSFYKAYKLHPFREEIRLLGYMPREDMPALYSHALVFIMPSFYEGFGMPLLEAMSCGTPCIVADNSSLSEIGGDAVDKFDTLDHRGLASLIRKYESDDGYRASRSKDVTARAEKFSWELYARQFDDLITQYLE